MAIEVAAIRLLRVVTEIVGIPIGWAAISVHPAVVQIGIWTTIWERHPSVCKYTLQNIFVRSGLTNHTHILVMRANM
jgi:hypothetical protein